MLITLCAFLAVLASATVNAFRDDYVLETQEDREIPDEGAKIIRSSHFYQAFKLGFKIKLICIARGKPVPDIKWFKNDVELDMKRNLHLQENIIEPWTIKGKIEIDPATVGDQGVYTCKANNKHAMEEKSFKTEYYF